MNTIEYIYDMNQRNKKLSNEKLYELINDIVYVWSHFEQKRVDLTPLEIEILMDNKEEVLNLINNGTDLNKISPSGYYPLEVAIAMSNYDLSKLLIENGANVNIQSEYTPLNVAVTMKSYQIVKLLIDNGVDINRVDEYGFNALHYLLNTGKIINMKRLTGLEYKFGKNMYKRPTEEDFVSIIDILVKNGIDVNCKGKIYGLHSVDGEMIEINPLSIALETSSSKVIEKLLESGSEKVAIEIHPYDVYAYQDSFDFLADIMDGDLSLWPDAPKEFIDYLKYKNRIKKFEIEVYSPNIGDGYRRPKVIKKLKKNIENRPHSLECCIFDEEDKK